MTREAISSIWVPKRIDMENERTWIVGKILEIGEEKLLDLAREAAKTRPNAYNPYSDYAVGASVLCTSGRIYSSCNAEVVSQTETDHAERGAISKAISEGEEKAWGRRFIRAIAVSHPGKSGPCGGCRQRIAEHADNALVLDVDEEGNIKKLTSLNILLPYSFNPSHLGI